MKLSPRLDKIVSLIPNGSVLADVGTDHGYVIVECFEKNIISHAIAMDVNAQPLDRARANITKSKFLSECEFRLSDGLEKLQRGEANVVVIAGMGGLLIRDILSAGIDKIDDNTLLLLQPMIAPCELREFMINNGLMIMDEYVVQEENKFYNIISAKKGTQIPDDEIIYVGKNLFINSGDAAIRYLDYKIKVCTKIINGNKNSVNPDIEMIKKYTYELSVYEKFKKEIII